MITKSIFTSYILPFILRFEGGYSNDPKDPGGKTYRGITYKNFPNWVGWETINKLNLKHNQIVDSLEPLVHTFYWNLFTGYGYHNFANSKLALVVFDYRVNGGMTFDKLATILNNFFNKKTSKSASQIMQIANTVNAEDLANKLLDNRKDYYETLIRQKPVLAKYRQGWFNRLAILRAYTNIKEIAISSVALILVGASIALLIK